MTTTITLDQAKANLLLLVSQLDEGEMTEQEYVGTTDHMVAILSEQGWRAEVVDPANVSTIVAARALHVWDPEESEDLADAEQSTRTWAHVNVFGRGHDEQECAVCRTITAAYGDAQALAAAEQ